jgi:hypothetical protein
LRNPASDPTIFEENCEDLRVNSRFRVDNLFFFLTKISPPFICYPWQCIYNLKAAIVFTNYHGTNVLCLFGYHQQFRPE